MRQVQSPSCKQQSTNLKEANTFGIFVVNVNNRSTIPDNNIYNMDAVLHKICCAIHNYNIHGYNYIFVLH